jgi:hypothetical protein
MEIDFDRCSDMALVVTRKVVNEFELDQRGLDEIAVFNVVLKAIIEYERISVARPTPLEQVMSGPDVAPEVACAMEDAF